MCVSKHVEMIGNVVLERLNPSSGPWVHVRFSVGPRGGHCSCLLMLYKPFLKNQEPLPSSIRRNGQPSTV